MEVYNKYVTFETLVNKMLELGWESTDEYSWWDTVDGQKVKVNSFTGEGSLCGGYSEQEAHEEILSELKKAMGNQEINCVTEWTYLEDLPTESYGKMELEKQTEEK